MTQSVRVIPPEERVIQRDPQNEKFDWFAELVAEIGPEHKFNPAIPLQTWEEDL